MASLLFMALEGSLGGIFGEIDLSMGANNTSGQPEAREGSPEKDTLVLKGPLAIQFSEALARVYNKHASDREDEAQVEEAQGARVTETQSMESQANDALMQQELVSNIQVMSQAEAPDNSTTVYGVDATDVKPEDIVEINQEIDSWGGDIPDFVVVMDADLPSENGQGGGENAQPVISELGKALESMCLANGVKVYYSLESLLGLFKKKKQLTPEERDAITDLEDKNGDLFKQIYKVMRGVSSDAKDEAEDELDRIRWTCHDAKDALEGVRVQQRDLKKLLNKLEHSKKE